MSAGKRPLVVSQGVQRDYQNLLQVSDHNPSQELAPPTQTSEEYFWLSKLVERLVETTPTAPVTSWHLCLVFSISYLSLFPARPLGLQLLIFLSSAIDSFWMSMTVPTLWIRLRTARGDGGTGLRVESGWSGLAHVSEAIGRGFELSEIRPPGTAVLLLLASMPISVHRNANVLQEH